MIVMDRARRVSIAHPPTHAHARVTGVWLLWSNVRPRFRKRAATTCLSLASIETCVIAFIAIGVAVGPGPYALASTTELTALFVGNLLVCTVCACVCFTPFLARALCSGDGACTACLPRDTIGSPAASLD